MLLMKTLWLYASTFTLAISLAAVACGDDDDDDNGNSGRSGASGKSGSAGGGAGGSAGGTGGNAGSGVSGGGSGGGSGSGGAGGASGASGTGGTGSVTFASLQPKFVSCLSATCHSATATTPQGGLALTYENVKNGTINANCAPYEKYIDLANPEQSFLYAKLASPADVPLDAACGGKMPPGSDNGAPNIASLVLDWIRAGAPEN
jgi:hypothetical protein